MFDRIDKILTHPGHAHRDEFMACCMALSELNVPVERRTAMAQDLDNPRILVLDQGRRYEPDFNNFDHHHFPKDAPATCALSLILRHMGIYEAAKEVFPWLTFTEIVDSKGPQVVSRDLLGISSDQLVWTLSPVESHILTEFGKYEYIGMKESLYTLMRGLGVSKREYLDKVFDRLDTLSKGAAKVSDFKGIKMVDVTTIAHDDHPILGLELWCRKHHPSVGISISWDDRSGDNGGGFCLYRRNDHPSVDFSRLKDLPEIVYVAANGFLAKTIPMAPEGLLALLDKAVQHDPGKILLEA